MAIEPVPPSVADLAADMLARTGGCILIAPMWGAKSAGTCMCPKGPDCATPAKHGPGSWKDNGTRELAKVETFLKNPGTPNYSIAPQDDLFIVDVDGEDILLWANWAKDMALPSTLTVGTANGYHVYFWLPKGVTAAPAKLNIGTKQLVVRSAAHPGYVLGPGSVHATGVTYSIKRDADIAIFPAEALKLSKMTKEPSSGSLITVTDGGGFVLEERYAKGGRYEAVRSYIAHLYNLGVPKRAREVMVRTELAPLFDPEYTEVELSGAIERSEGKLEERLGPPAVAAKMAEAPEAVAARVAAAGDIWVSAADYMAANAAAPEWCGPLAVFGAVSLISGPPKAGKSTLISNLLWARTSGELFLWGEPVPVGPTLYITEEGGASVVAKLDDALDLDVIDMQAFRLAGLGSRADILAVIDRWCEGKRGEPKPMVVVDTFAAWGAVGDENDSVETTRAINDLRMTAQRWGVAMPLVAHTRKGGGEQGEAIRGSSAIYGTVELSIEFRYTTKGAADDARLLSISGRYGSPEVRLLEYDRTESRYSAGSLTPDLVDVMDLPEAGEPKGLTTTELAEKWKMTDRAASNKANALWKADRLVRVAVKEGRATHYEYFRPRSVLRMGPAVGSVGERMADIFSGASPSDDGSSSL